VSTDRPSGSVAPPESLYRPSQTSLLRHVNTATATQCRDAISESAGKILTESDTDGEVSLLAMRMLAHLSLEAVPRVHREYFRLRHQYQMRPRAAICVSILLDRYTPPHRSTPCHSLESV
jgi:hypothetical protein